jgi:hypothetical protein
MSGKAVFGGVFRVRVTWGLISHQAPSLWRSVFLQKFTRLVGGGVPAPPPNTHTNKYVANQIVVHWRFLKFGQWPEASVAGLALVRDCSCPKVCHA